VSIFGDFFDAFTNAVDGSSPQEPAPVPTVASSPPRTGEPVTWTAPDASGGGHLVVHRDVLHSVARGMVSDLKELDAAVAGVRGASGGLGSLRGWSTGTAFGVNATNACHGFAEVGTQTADTQSAASKALADSAASYEDAETASHRAVSGVRSQLDAAGGHVAG
jgi:hypothetical protein